MEEDRDVDRRRCSLSLGSARLGALLSSSCSGISSIEGQCRSPKEEGSGLRLPLRPEDIEAA